MTACPSWCRGNPHRSEPVQVVHDRQRVCLWLQHEPGDLTPSLGLTATVTGVGAPAVELPWGSARELSDGLLALIHAAT